MTKFMHQLEREARGKQALGAIAAALLTAVGAAFTAYGCHVLGLDLWPRLAIAAITGGLAGYWLGQQLINYSFPIHINHCRWVLLEGNLLATVISDNAYEFLPNLGKNPENNGFMRRWERVRHTDSFRQRLRQMLQSWSLCCKDLGLPPRDVAWRQRLTVPWTIISIIFIVLVLVWNTEGQPEDWQLNLQQLIISSPLFYIATGLLFAPVLGLLLADLLAANSALRLALLSCLSADEDPEPPASQYSDPW
ncbi:hypothetical protein JW859_04765 [bacterium]|nr:hypothetical protein [bacterium]